VSFRIFKRVSWRLEPSRYGLPGKLVPSPYPMDKCRTIETVDTFQDAVDYCTERNDQRPASSPARELAGMYEFTQCD